MKRIKRGEEPLPEGEQRSRIGIRAKLMLELALLVGFIITLVWVCQIALLMSLYGNFRSGQVRSAADAMLKNIDNEDLDELADRISAENDVCMMLVDGEGAQIISSDHVRFCLLHHMNRKELKAVLDATPADGSEKIEMATVAPFRNEKYHAEKFEGRVPEEDSSTGRSMLYSRRVTFGDGSGGTLLINAQISPTDSLLGMMRAQFGFIVFLILIVTAVVGTLMAASVSRPIINTNRAAKALSGASYRRPPHSGSYREIAELNDTLVQAAEDLKRVETLEKELVANISHDLRTPLTMIQGYAETMRDIPDEINPENMQIIIDETNRLSSLVSEVLEFSRMRSGNEQLSMGEFDLTETVRAICQRVSAMTEKEGYRVVCRAAEPHMVRGDSARVEQVVYNLLGNALTYTGENKEVVLKEEDRGDRIRISVSDSGKGIAPEELPYIWDRYYRTKESHRRAVIGSGLGLNICRSILEKHQVPYGVESREGVGTTFWFELEKA